MPTAWIWPKALPDEAEREKWQGLVELLIPVCKAYSSDKAMEVCSKAIDVYGGYGYCQEYPVSSTCAIARSPASMRGTNGIQSLDLVGRKLAQRKGMNVMNMFGEIGATIAAAKGIAELNAYALRLEEAYNAVVDMTMALAQLGKSSGFLIPILNASPYLDIFGDLLCRAISCSNRPPSQWKN